jgi:hypothetical protein
MNMPCLKKSVERATLRESDIIVALSQSNRYVTHEILASWRRRGLLPAFDSKGMGRGRSFHWTDSQVTARAEYVFDALSKNLALDEIYTGLWLQGYDIPLPLFRRCWRNWLKTQNRRKSNRTAAALAIEAAPHACSNLEISLLWVLAKGVTPIEGFSIFGAALNTLARALGEPQPLKTETLLLFHSLTLVFECSHLLENTSDQALSRAQGYVVNLLAALNASAALGKKENGLPPVWPVLLYTQTGSPFLWMILSLMSSGHEEELASSMAVVSELMEVLQRPSHSWGKVRSLDEERLRRLRTRLAELWRPLLCAPYQRPMQCGVFQSFVAE